ncbi:MAG: XylR family transcriptional regulator [Fimbriiglobus sp.]
MARRRVALLVESSRSYGRGLLHGLAEYARITDRWIVTLDDRGLTGRVPDWLRGWRGDGIIARVESEPMARAVRATGVPVVDLRGLIRDPAFPLVETDEPEVVRLAFAHLTERGFRTVAFCGFDGTNYSEARGRLFAAQAARAGIDCHMYHPPTVRRGPTADVERACLAFEPHLAGWLAGLPKPIGLMACNDIRGQQVLETCRQAGIAVPDEIGVIGVDNDELLCELCFPALSSVVPDTRMIGLEAGALLDDLMAGRPPPGGPIYVPPRDVVARSSTDALADADPVVVTSVRFIREHACDGIGVEDVLARVRCSRSTLERAFDRSVGHSPKAEINRVRVERIKHLLAATAYPLIRVATMTGFEHPEYLSVFFRREVGQTPGQFRDAARQAGPTPAESAPDPGRRGNLR